MFDSLKRRDLLKKSGVLALGMMTFPAWMPRIAFRSKNAASLAQDTIVVIFLRGGADGLNMVVPHGDRGYYAGRQATAVGQPNARSEESAIDLDGFFGLHPALRPLTPFWQEGTLAAVHAVGSPDPTHSHFDAMDYMERGTPGEKAMATGWIGRHLQAQASESKSPFRAVGMGTIVQQSLRGSIPAIALQSISDFHLKGEQAQIGRFQQTISALYEGDEFLEIEGQETLAAMDTLAKIANQKYEPANGAKYPRGFFGQSLLTLAQLIKADLGVEVGAVDMGGWDTHQAQGGGKGQMAKLLEEFAEGLAAFYADMGAGMKNVTVVTMSEFGRRVRENSSKGTDHGHGNVMFLLGRNVNGGRVFGDWPTLEPSRLYGPGDLEITTDFRDVLGEVVQKRAGNGNLEAVFPNYGGFNFRGVVKG